MTRVPKIDNKLDEKVVFDSDRIEIPFAQVENSLVLARNDKVRFESSYMRQLRRCVQRIEDINRQTESYKEEEDMKREEIEMLKKLVLEKESENKQTTTLADQLVDKLQTNASRCKTILTTYHNYIAGKHAKIGKKIRALILENTKLGEQLKQVEERHDRVKQDLDKMIVRNERLEEKLRTLKFEAGKEKREKAKERWTDSERELHAAVQKWVESCPYNK